MTISLWKGACLQNKLKTDRNRQSSPLVNLTAAPSDPYNRVL